MMGTGWWDWMEGIDREFNVVSVYKSQGVYPGRVWRFCGCLGGLVVLPPISSCRRPAGIGGGKSTITSQKFLRMRPCLASGVMRSRQSGGVVSGMSKSLKKCGKEEFHRPTGARLVRGECGPSQALC